MIRDWQELTRLVGEDNLLIERVKLATKGISVEGQFDLPPLAKLAMEDQVFIAAFVRSHGSIKQMEQLFGISYPTVKNRLNRIAEKLDFVDITPVEDRSEILARLERGEITTKEAIERLKK
jgi:hypothetical protein